MSNDIKKQENIEQLKHALERLSNALMFDKKQYDDLLVENQTLKAQIDELKNERTAYRTLNALIGDNKRICELHDEMEVLEQENSSLKAQIDELEAKFEIMCKNFSDEKEFREKIESQYQKAVEALKIYAFEENYSAARQTLAELGEKE